MGISEATFYNWKKKYSGLEVSELRRLRRLEQEKNKVVANYDHLKNLKYSPYLALAYALIPFQLKAGCGKPHVCLPSGFWLRRTPLRFGST
jgi:hypothetical protein